MKQLNEKATRIFCRLIKKLNGQQLIKLFSEGFMPLNMERMEENILTPDGVGTTYSLCHYYKLNGDLMRDPEMVFIVVDNRKEEKDIEAIHIYPQLYQLDSLGLYEESIRIDNGQIKSFIKTWQAIALLPTNGFATYKCRVLPNNHLPGMTPMPGYSKHFNFLRCRPYIILIISSGQSCSLIYCPQIFPHSLSSLNHLPNG